MYRFIILFIAIVSCFYVGCGGGDDSDSRSEGSLEGDSEIGEPSTTGEVWACVWTETTYYSHPSAGAWSESETFCAESSTCNPDPIDTVHEEFTADSIATDVQSFRGTCEAYWASQETASSPETEDCDGDACTDVDVLAEVEYDDDPVTACSDGLDNDNNGLTDCADAVCFSLFEGDEVCEESYLTTCTNGIDDDGDGLSDCDDPDCADVIVEMGTETELLCAL